MLAFWFPFFAAGVAGLARKRGTGGGGGNFQVG
jgi:hypothetical protein